MHLTNFLWVVSAARWINGKEWLKRKGPRSATLGPIIFCIIGVVCFGIAGFWYFIGTKKINPLDNTIVIECARGLMPNVVPQNGRIDYIQLHPTPGRSGRVGQPGDKWDWLEGGQEAYRCVVKNYGKETVTDIEIPITAYLLEVIKTDNGTHSGEVQHTSNYIITIPVLEADAANEHEFYICNGSVFYARAQISESVSLRRMGDEKQQSVKLKSYTGGTPLISLVPVFVGTSKP